jgi:hypothetical protein
MDQFIVLRNLDLCDTLAKLSESHKKEAEEYIKKLSLDSAVSIMLHRCRYYIIINFYGCSELLCFSPRCESSAYIQGEIDRFYTALHLLFDFTKSVMGFEYQSRIATELEVTLSIAGIN